MFTSPGVVNFPSVPNSQVCPLFVIIGVLTPYDDVTEPERKILFLKLTLPLISTAYPSIDDGIVDPTLPVTSVLIPMVLSE
ncbi:hypothetical protein DCBHLPFO_00676 [Mycoplasmopsis arginini]|uniref:Uncharacterized protein n=1 Tax=Mycoplasmopsis arginini TaxID=2094 RepID=A0AA43U362_MYCAR|nr:hypothetical protein [Mycoplasmopsis arginini]